MKFKILVIYVLALCIFSCVGCMPDHYEPENGVWYCEELQIQLSYEVGKECFAIINGEKIIAACGSDRGVRRLCVSSQQENHPEYIMGDTLFEAEILSLDEREFIVFDEKAQTEYVFYRIE